MKKMIFAVVFAVVFVAAYLALCFAIPAFRIKLDAAPMVYFVESITHMAFFKALVSFIAAMIAGVIALMVRK